MKKTTNKINEDAVDEALMESFPASDPPAWTLGQESKQIPESGQPVIYTIGHSTRPIEAFIAMLKNFSIAQLVDVRTIPQSRYNPQYGQAALAQSLSDEKIRYVHMPGLGGMKKPQEASINEGLRNSSFRGYADYMQTAAFEENLEKLMAMSQDQPTAIMCAEAVPWRCHRSMIADALISRGWQVIDIMDAGHEKVHSMHAVAKINEGKIYYPKDV